MVMRVGPDTLRGWGVVSRRTSRRERRPGRLQDPGQPGRRWWGDLYELCPDDLLSELNGQADGERISALPKRHRAQRR